MGELVLRLGEKACTPPAIPRQQELLLEWLRQRRQKESWRKGTEGRWYRRTVGPVAVTYRVVGEEVEVEFSCPSCARRLFQRTCVESEGPPVLRTAWEFFLAANPTFPLNEAVYGSY